MAKAYPTPPPATREQLVDKLHETNDQAKAIQISPTWVRLHVEMNKLLDWIVGR